MAFWGGSSTPRDSPCWWGMWGGGVSGFGQVSAWCGGGMESFEGFLAPRDRSDVSFTLPFREPLHSTEL